MQSQPSDIGARLWTAARAMFARLSAAIGESAAIAAREALDAKEVRTIRAWLRPLEAMVRQIVLIEAIALARLGPPAPRRRSAASERAQRSPRPRASLRLWPRQPASAGPRVRNLGAPVLVREVWRDRARLAAARHFDTVRGQRAPLQQRLARRIDALGRIIARPLPAARRLAVKLRVTPKLALKLACARYPRTRLYDNPEISLAAVTAFGDARAFLPDTS